MSTTRRRRRWLWIGVPVVLLLSAGLLVYFRYVRSFSDERRVSIPPMQVKSVSYATAWRDRHLRFEVRSPKAPIDVYLTLGDDRDALIKQLESEKVPTQFLVQRSRVSEMTLEAVIPAGQSFALVFTSRGSPNELSAEVQIAEVR